MGNLGPESGEQRLGLVPGDFQIQGVRAEVRAVGPLQGAAATDLDPREGGRISEGREQWLLKQLHQGNLAGHTIVEATQPDIDPNSSINLGGNTGFFRVIVGLGAGGAYAGPITFLHPEQAANLDRKFAPGNPNHLLLNRYTDPRQGRTAVALQAYASVEAGCATFSIERTS